MKKKFNIRERYKNFRAWREKPHEVAPMSKAEHECATCGTHFTGNYCPRCGQSERIGRYSFRTALLNFMDVWGLGNRSMFLTIRDLILRPGYMIRDFLKGMQMAYFPPFKMFFLLTALSLLVTHGLNIKGQNLANVDETDVHEVITDTSENDASTIEIGDSGSKDEVNQLSERTKEVIVDAVEKMVSFAQRFPSINMLLALMIVSVVLYLFFRHCPNIPDMRYSEFFVSLVYISNMFSIYSIVFDFFCLRQLSTFSFFLTLIPLKQLTGYSWWRTILKSIAAVIIMFALFIVFIVLAVFIAALYVKLFG